MTENKNVADATERLVALYREAKANSDQTIVDLIAFIDSLTEIMAECGDLIDAGHVDQARALIEEHFVELRRRTLTAPPAGRA